MINKEGLLCKLFYTDKSKGMENRSLILCHGISLTPKNHLFKRNLEKQGSIPCFSIPAIIPNKPVSAITDSGS